MSGSLLRQLSLTFELFSPLYFYFLLLTFFSVSLNLLLVLLFITIPLSFGCSDEEISLFVGQIKGILILLLSE